MGKSHAITYSLDGLLTVAQTAAKLSVKVRTVRDWVSKRKISHTKFERRVYISADVIEERLQRASVSELRNSPGPTLAEQGGAHLAGGET